MADVTKMSSSINRIIVFVFWLISACLLIFMSGISLYSIEYDIARVNPSDESAVRHDPEKVESVLAEMGVDTSDCERPDTNREINKHIRDQQEQKLTELSRQRTVNICWLVCLSIYVISGIVLFIFIRDKQNIKVLSYILLILVNVLVFYNFPFGG